MSGACRIFCVSTTIFHSSLVEPSSRKTSICGMQLKAMRCAKLRGSNSRPAKKSPVCS